MWRDLSGVAWPWWLAEPVERQQTVWQHDGDLRCEAAALGLARE